MADLRPLSIEERQKAIRNGIRVPDTAVTDGDNIFSSAEAATAPPPTTVQPYSAGPLGLNLAGRQLSRAILPTLGGAGAAAGVTSALGALGAPVTGGASLLLPLAAGVIGGIATKKAQDEAIKYATKDNPNSWLAQNEEQAQEDVRQHPRWSAITALPAAGIAPGGSFIPRISSALSNPRQAAILAGVMGGTDVATQLATRGEVDPGAALISALGGASFAKYKAPAVEGATPTDYENQARAAHATTALANPPQVKQPAYTNPQFLQGILDMPAKELTGMAGNVQTGEANFLRSAAALKEFGLPLNMDHLKRLAAEGPIDGFDVAAMRILTDDFPAYSKAQRETATANQLSAAAAEAGQKGTIADIHTKATQEQAARQKAIDESMARAQEATQANPPPEPRVSIVQGEPGGAYGAAREPGITRTEIPGPKSAAESAAVIAGSKKASDPIKAFRDDEAAINKVIEFANEFQEGHPQREVLLRTANEMRTRAEQKLQDALSAQSRVVPELTDLRTAGEIENPRKIGAIEEKNVSEEGGDEGALESGEETPVEPPPPKPTETPLSAEQQAQADQLRELAGNIKGSLPEKPVVGSPKAAELGVAPKPGQKQNLGSPGDAFRTMIGTVSKEGGKARNILREHPLVKDQKLDTIQAMQDAYDALPSSERIRMQELLTSGSEHWISKLGAAEQAKSAQARIGKALSQPGKPKAAEAVPAPKVEPKQGMKYRWPDGIWRDTPPPEAPAKKAETPAKVEAGGKTLKEIREGTPNKEGGFITLPSLGELVKRVGEPTVERIKKGLRIRGRELPGTEGGLERIARKGPLGNYVAKAINSMDIEQRQVENEAQQIIFDQSKKVAPEERTGAVYNYLKARENGAPLPTLTPAQQEMVDSFDKIIKETGYARQVAGPFVSRFTPEGGAVKTPLYMKEGYIPHTIDPDVAQFLRDHGEDDPHWRQLREDYIRHMMDKAGLNRKEAENSFESRLNPSFGGKQTPNAEFRALRLEEGYGLPDSWRDHDIVRSMKTYMTKYSHDMAFHKWVESDPKVARALGIEDNGRGQAHPENVDIEGRPIVKGELQGNPDIQAAMRNFVGGFDPSSQMLEKPIHLISAGSLQTLTQAKNYIQNIFKTPELVKTDEYPMVLKAIKDAFTPEAKQRALRSGAVRATRNVLPTVAQDVNNKMTQIADLMTKATGSEKLAQINDITLNEIGRMVAMKRIAEGDTEFINKLAPNNWRSMDFDKLVDHMSTEFSRNFAGSYGPKGVPNMFLRGNQSTIGRYMSLSRWSVERFNRWYSNVYEPATKGDFKPFLRSAVGTMIGASALNALTQIITDKKPKELTWSEYFKLGGKDHAYMLFSKMAAMSDMGILSDALFGLTQMAYGEKPRGFNNLAISAFADGAERIGQYLNAVGKGDVDAFSGLLTLATEIMKDRIQVVRIAMQENDDTGKREERIARRLGYLPSRFSGYSSELANPFSEAAAYRNEDATALARILDRKISQGQTISAPDSEYRTARMNTATGSRGYYDFIDEAQGPEARAKAEERDINNTVKKRALYGEALNRRLK